MKCRHHQFRATICILIPAGLQIKLNNQTRPAIYLRPAQENVVHHHMWFPNTKAISKSDKFFVLSDQVKFKDWDGDEELAPSPPFSHPTARPEPHAGPVIDLVGAVPVDTIHRIKVDNDDDDIRSLLSHSFSMSSAQPPSPNILWIAFQGRAT
jgi:hypothetical protein